jgi:hypothetical protein
MNFIVPDLVTKQVSQPNPSDVKKKDICSSLSSQNLESACSQDSHLTSMSNGSCTEQLPLQNTVMKTSVVMAYS